VKSSVVNYTLFVKVSRFSVSKFGHPAVHCFTKSRSQEFPNIYSGEGHMCCETHPAMYEKWFGMLTLIPQEEISIYECFRSTCINTVHVIMRFEIFMAVDI
jgi:hypothetical protein